MGNELGETFFELLKVDFLINTTRIELKHDISSQFFTTLNAHMLLDKGENLREWYITLSF